MKMRRLVPILLLALTLVVSGCTGGIPGCGVAVPDVKGKTAAQAETTLKTAGFALGKITFDEAAEGAPGAVVSQEPAAGSSSQPGAVVNLTVAGAAPVKVPVLVGLSQDAAAAALASAGLTLGNVAQSSSDTITAGVIASQSPEAGADAPRDSSVDVVVSTGPAPVAVPSVTGKSRDAAVGILQGAGFAVTVKDKADAAATGTVIGQSPAAGTAAAAGSTVTLTVSTGEPAHVKVPYLKSLKLQAAKDKLTGMGLKWDHIYGPGDGMLSPGFVYKQVPAPNAVVDAGSTVKIYTWKP